MSKSVSVNANDKAKRSAKTGSGEAKRERKPQLCYNCAQPGHKSHACPTKKKGGAKTRGSHKSKLVSRSVGDSLQELLGAVDAVRELQLNRVRAPEDVVNDLRRIADVCPQADAAPAVAAPAAPPVAKPEPPAKQLEERRRLFDSRPKRVATKGGDLNPPADRRPQPPVEARPGPQSAAPKAAPVVPCAPKVVPPVAPKGPIPVVPKAPAPAAAEPAPANPYENDEGVGNLYGDGEEEAEQEERREEEARPVDAAEAQVAAAAQDGGEDGHEEQPEDRRVEAEAEDEEEGEFGLGGLFNEPQDAPDAVIEVREPPRRGGEGPVPPADPPHVPNGGGVGGDVVIDVPPEEEETGEWHIDENNAILRGLLPNWGFEYHDAPAFSRSFFTESARMFSYVVFVASLFMMVVTSPSFIPLMSMVILVTQVAVYMASQGALSLQWRMLRRSHTSFVDTVSDIYQYGLFHEEIRDYLGYSKRMANWASMIVGSGLVILTGLFLAGVVEGTLFYFHTVMVIANLFHAAETTLLNAFVPLPLLTWAYGLPPTVHNMFMWAMWLKYVYLLARSFVRGVTDLALATRKTHVSFVGFEIERSPFEARSWTFRNQDLNTASCPIRIELKRTIFYWFVLDRVERVMSATMMMELCCHKYVNGTADLTDTRERIDRAFRTTGYLNIPADDVFAVEDTAEVSRIIAHHWAKSRVEVNYRLRLLDF